MRLLITNHDIGKWMGYYVAAKILKANPTKDKPFVLGLPTGSTPLKMYKSLIELHLLGKISFANVVTFNMDEYVGLKPNHKQSYRRYMYESFFNYIDIKLENINLLDPHAANLELECANYESKIKALGGIDLMIGGVGEDGHIAFNEPGSSLNSTTRVKTLSYSTISANSRFFEFNLEETPKLALTMGVKTILDSKEIIIMACGVNKANAICHVVEGAVSSFCPVSALQMHNNALILCDEYAAYELKLKTFRYYQNLDDEYHKFDQELKDL